MRKKNTILTILTSISIIVIIYSGILFLIKISDTFDYEIGYTAEEYEKFKGRVLNSDKYMPIIGQLTNVDEFKTSYAKHFKPLELWSVTESVTLTCPYKNDNNYYDAKKQLYSNLLFLNKQDEVLRDVFAKCDGYDVSVVDKISFDVYDNSYWYPHCFLMIGFNDESNKLIYMFHYDSEIDYINNLDEFIKESYYLK